MRFFLKIIKNNQKGDSDMYQSERMDEILSILKKYNYVTVDYLVKQIKYSPASIRRDLTLLENQGLVKRSYGGVTLKSETLSPFVFRQHSMKTIKNRIAAKAATLIKDNDTIFIDGSSSAQYIGPHLVNKKGITVITNNMALTSYLGENGIQVYCTGGYISELPGILLGEITANTFAGFHADIMFFSATGYNGGIIFGNDEACIRNHRIMLKNSDKRVFLCGSDKFEKKYKLKVCGLESIDYFVTDAQVSDDDKEKYKTTEFMVV